MPRQLIDLMSSEDSGQNERVMQAMMKVIKLEIAPLEQAARAA